MGMIMKIYEILSKKVIGVFVVEMMQRDILYLFYVFVNCFVFCDFN